MSVELVFDSCLLAENLRKEGWKECYDALKTLFGDDYGKLGYFVLFRDKNAQDRHAMRGFEGKYWQHADIPPPVIDGFEPEPAGGANFRVNFYPPVPDDHPLAEFYKDGTLKNRLTLSGMSTRFGRPDWDVVEGLAQFLPETELYQGFEIRVER